jgi:hypothetical protein
MYTWDYDDPDHGGDNPEEDAMAMLLGHIRVNAIGDYFQVDGLVSLSNSKLKELLHYNGEVEAWIMNFPAAIGEAAESTGDKALLELLAEASTANISQLLTMEEFRRLPVMSDFVVHLLQASIRRNQALREELECTQRELRDAKYEAEERERDVEVRGKQMEILSRTSRCKNCSADFPCSFWPDEYCLRCDRCRCRHW